MTKYRIVSRPTYIDPKQSVYVAQHKFLNLFWVDVDFDPNYPGCSKSEHLEHVEEYIDSLIHNKRLDKSQKVVKVYD